MDFSQKSSKRWEVLKVALLTQRHPTIKEEGEAVNKLDLLTYCGLYCGLCAQRGRIPRQATALRESMVKEGYEFWAKELPRFSEFWKFLSNLCDPNKSCPGCRQNGGPPFCSIRKCARDSKIDTCVFCGKYPCERIIEVARGYPTLIADGKRMKDIGLEAWIDEQEQRARTGFSYADVRCHPYKVPDK